MTIPGLGTASSQPTAVIQASPVEWGVTIPSNSSHRDTAIAFVAALLGAPGRAALTTNGPAPLSPARVSRADYGKVPAPLEKLVTAR